MFEYVELDEALVDKDDISKYYPKNVQSKFDRIVKDILSNPRNKVAIGRPERLKHVQIETWSRELTQKDRILYSIEPGKKHGFLDEEIVVFHHYLGHYDDK